MSIQQGINQLITQGAFLYSQSPLAAKQKDKYIQQRRIQEKEEAASKASTLASKIEGNLAIFEQREKLVEKHGENSPAVKQFDKEKESRLQDAKKISYEADRELALMDPEKYGERYARSIAENAYNQGYYTPSGRRRKVPKSRPEAMNKMQETAVEQIEQQKLYNQMLNMIQGGGN